LRDADAPSSTMPRRSRSSPSRAWRLSTGQRCRVLHPGCGTPASVAAILPRPAGVPIRVDASPGGRRRECEPCPYPSRAGTNQVPPPFIAGTNHAGLARCADAIDARGLFTIVCATQVAAQPWRDAYEAGDYQSMCRACARARTAGTSAVCNSSRAHSGHVRQHLRSTGLTPPGCKATFEMPRPACPVRLEQDSAYDEGRTMRGRRPKSPGRRKPPPTGCRVATTSGEGPPAFEFGNRREG
jgi:hypothetical protein